MTEEIESGGKNEVKGKTPNQQPIKKRMLLRALGYRFLCTSLAPWTVSPSSTSYHE
jgi:hypothetical protein